ncbi:sugar phosphate isomerase [Amycolatopsis rhizosphaerae]|uniref:Sugar phosphate isomerase n=1 Tax=Amycolatopsis rhizosphaerae TaxID=2053003 RepID=A0A558CJJ5_9PSEU|nr:sugar phosphate isomerase [Amycolatopsis rhizosphaerae]
MALSPAGAAWLTASLDRVARDGTAIRTLFPAAGRHCGRGPLGAGSPAFPEWTVDDGARVLLLTTATGVASELADLYHHGSAAEQRAVLRGLSCSDFGDRGLPLVTEALRSNDPRLVATAMGPYAASWLEDSAYRHGVLKCVFMGIPLDAVAGLDEHTDDELIRMMRSFALERTAAGRPVPADLLARLPDLHRQDS